MPQKIFLADAMLKKLARWLRILGIETIYPEDFDDSNLLQLAEKQKLTLLTQDVELSKRAEKRKIKCLLIPTGISFEQQLALVLDSSDLKIEDFPSRMLCPKCNGRLLEAAEEAVRGKLHEDLLGKEKVFWKCKECGHVYWEGSHWEKIKKTAEKIKKLLAQARR